jgi:hypothetical protein
MLAHRARPYLARGWAIVRVVCCGLPAVLLLLPGAGVLSAQESPAAAGDVKLAAAEVEFFESKIRPLLVQRCYECHARDSKELQGGLYLDSRGGWLKGGDTGPAIVPGKPDESRLIRAVRYDNNDLQMPPSGKLPAAEIALLEEWVRRGAPDPRSGDEPQRRAMEIDYQAARQFWSFRPVVEVPLPAVQDAAWCRTPIDRFVRAKQESLGLTPAPQADRRRLIRRAYFDLLGLPPSPEAIAAFEADQRGDAYERLIDELLDSPHFGERWGRHWLDVARFAESHGFEQDYDRPHAYHYRDFVIKALNADMAYDQFVRWQLAGDELEPDNPLAMMATGFLGAGVFPTQITANEVEKSRYDALDDMAATMGTALLGLTIGCARCHDHKFDPISTHDYYRLVSTFTTTVRSDIELDLEPHVYRQAKEAFDAEHAPLAGALEAFEKQELPALFETWLAERVKKPGPPPTWVLAEVVQARSPGGAQLQRQPDGSFLLSGNNPQFDTYTLVIQTKLRGITALRIEALADPSLPHGGPGRAANGNFALTDVRLTIAPLIAKPGGNQEPQSVQLTDPRATFEQAGLPIAAAIDGDPKSGWAVDPQFGKNHAAVLNLAQAVGFEGGTRLICTLKFENNAGHNIGRPRLAISTAATPDLEGDPQPEAVVAALAAIASGKPLGELEAAQQAALREYHKGTVPQWRQLQQAVQDHLAQAPKPKLTKVMVCSEGFTPIRHHTQGADFFNETYFLVRGDVNRKQQVATQSFLQLLMTAPDAERHWQVAPPEGWRTSYRRRALAAWITDTQYGAGHLLARVIVNRLWQHHFGQGIVATPNDFGAQGAPPTHPELLDWLALELIRGQWRLKPLHKQIMSSAAYLQSSAIDPANSRIDPENRFLWRYSPRRLEGEIIRDAMLAVSDELDRTMYGPGTLDEGHRRRSIYFTIKRSKLVPMMQLFDAPDTVTSSGSRPRTTIAPQALLFLNSPHVRGYAKSFAQRLEQQAKEPAEAVRLAYRLALGRQPDETEFRDATAFVEAQATSYQEANGTSPRRLALTDFCQVLLSLNEFVYID